MLYQFSARTGYVRVEDCSSFFFECGGIAERAHRGVAGFLRTHADGNVFGNLLVEVELDFVV